MADEQGPITYMFTSPAKSAVRTSEGMVIPWGERANGNAHYEILKIRVEAGEITIAEYVAPVRPRVVPREITFRQLYTKMAIEGMISVEDAKVFISDHSKLPPVMVGMLEAIEDPTEQFIAYGLATGANEIYIDNPVAIMFGAKVGLDQAGLEDFWIEASRL